MKLAIDASHICDGGGVTHLLQFLLHLEPKKTRITEVTVWSNKKTLSLLPQKPWLTLNSHSLLNKGLWQRVFWQIFFLSKELAPFDLLFVPGGYYLGKFRPVIVMNQNLLPFDKKALHTYPLGLDRLRFYILKKLYCYTFQNADAIIFLSHFAKEIVEKNINLPKKYSIIPPGVHFNFHREKNKIHSKQDKRINLLYVSRLEPYKNHHCLLEAAFKLCKEGYEIKLILIGQSENKFIKKFKARIENYYHERLYIEHLGCVPYKTIVQYYHEADIFIFASYCESFGQILLEAMMSALPIIASNVSAIPEVLNEAAIFFDPDNSTELAEKIKFLTQNSEFCQSLSIKAETRAKNFTWQACVDKTIHFFNQV